MENQQGFIKVWRYQVTATLQDRSAEQQYIDWLMAGHLQAVCKWAFRAEIVPLDYGDLSPQVMSIYWFFKRDEFDLYEVEGAPLLRKEGIEFAKTLGGITFERQMGWAWQPRGLN